VPDTLTLVNLKNSKPDPAQKFSITPCLQIFKHPHHPRSKNFNRDHDRVSKSFTDQPHLDFHFSIAITYAIDKSQNRHPENTSFRCAHEPVFQQEPDQNQSADQSNLDLKFSTDPMTLPEIFLSRSRSRLKTVH
jgi:hypothetical protein